MHFTYYKSYKIANFMSEPEQQLNRLPEENIKEARRLVKSLELGLKEIREEAKKIQLEDLRKNLGDSNG